MFLISRNVFLVTLLHHCIEAVGNAYVTLQRWASVSVITRQW